MTEQKKDKNTKSIYNQIIASLNYQQYGYYEFKNDLGMKMVYAYIPTTDKIMIFEFTGEDILESIRIGIDGRQEIE